MSTQTQKKAMMVIAVLVALSAMAMFGAGQTMAGELEPSGTPGPTMKTLDDVEPGIPISTLPYTISAPGLYYLTGELGTASTGITVDSHHVTIDLKGYSITGMGTDAGIYLGTRNNVEIRNGTIRNFLAGIYSDNNTAYGGQRVIGIRAVNNPGTGIFLNAFGSLVKDCVAKGNERGIVCQSASTVVGNVVAGNNSNGIMVVDASVVTGNTVSENGGDGIIGGYGCTVTGNAVYNSGGYGIDVKDASNVSGNTVNFNTGDGIVIIGGCKVTNNHCSMNGLYEGDGAGIRATGTGNHIVGNNVRGNDRGIDVEANNNLILKNSASNNTANYQISAGNSYGPIVDVSAGVGDISGTANADNPWANFQH